MLIHFSFSYCETEWSELENQTTSLKDMKSDFFFYVPNGWQRVDIYKRLMNKRTNDRVKH